MDETNVSSIVFPILNSEINELYFKEYLSINWNSFKKQMKTNWEFLTSLKFLGGFTFLKDTIKNNVDNIGNNINFVADIVTNDQDELPELSIEEIKQMRKLMDLVLFREKELSDFLFGQLMYHAPYFADEIIEACRFKPV